MIKLLILVNMLALLCVEKCTSQTQEYESTIYDRIDSIVKRTLGTTYDAGSVLDVDSVLHLFKRERRPFGVFEDPRGELSHCVIATFSRRDSAEDEAGIALIQADTIVWRSRRFIFDYSHLRSNIYGFADLNNDSTTDIIVSISYGRGLVQGLWLVSPDDQGGTLLNSFDEFGYSSIQGADGMFEVVQSLDSPAKVITGWGLEQQRSVLFKWNGSLFVKADDQ
jgi:hypothetical protein